MCSRILWTPSHNGLLRYTARQCVALGGRHSAARSGSALRTPREARAGAAGAGPSQYWRLDIRWTSGRRRAQGEAPRSPAPLAGDGQHQLEPRREHVGGGLYFLSRRHSELAAPRTRRTALSISSRVRSGWLLTCNALSAASCTRLLAYKNSARRRSNTATDVRLITSSIAC